VPGLLALTAHPDDAEITMAGTLARYAAAGWDVTVAVFTSSSARIREAAEAAAGVTGHRLVWVDGGSRPWVEDFRETELVSIVDGLVREHRPEIIISHWSGDPHRDHARLSHAALASLRRCDASLYALPPSEFRSPAYDAFPANVFVDISDHVHVKEQALAHFQYDGWAWQEVDTPTLLALARATGARLGWQAAETFLTVRQVGLTGPDVAGPMPDTVNHK
jgi:N-acetylglucosamine malate deacetylase 1